VWTDEIIHLRLGLSTTALGVREASHRLRVLKLEQAVHLSQIGSCTWLKQGRMKFQLSVKMLTLPTVASTTL
jgi:hypothetical protein